MNKRESMRGEGEWVVVRVKEAGETAVLGGDELNVVSVADDLEDGVAVDEVLDPSFAGEEGVDDGEEELCCLEPRVGFLGPDREGAGSV